MTDDKIMIKKFLNSINTENFAEAYENLKAVLHEKTKKRCSAEYEKVKKQHLKNK